MGQSISTQQIMYQSCDRTDRNKTHKLKIIVCSKCGYKNILETYICDFSINKCKRYVKKIKSCYKCKNNLIA